MKKKKLEPKQLKEAKKLLELDKYKYKNEFGEIEGFRKQNQYNESFSEMYQTSEDQVLEYPKGLVTREDWGADYPMLTEPLKKPIKFIELTYSTFTERCQTLKECVKLVNWMQFRDVEDIAMYDIQPNFLIGGDARVYEGRGWDARPNDNLDYPYYNGIILEIAFIGHDRNGTVPPTPAMYKAATGIIKYGLKNKLISDGYRFLR